jgi:2-polyprenyl-6-methoxyphenol hydroxylase-like FAD-dependent oxidoreductase
MGAQGAWRPKAAVSGPRAVNDIFDREPLPVLVDRRVLLLGDSAHPITPHAGKVGRGRIVRSRCCSHA